MDGQRWELEYPIADASRIGDQVVVLYHADARRETFGQFRNLVAFDLRGRRCWEAELPTNESGDCYVRIASIEPLRADSWKGFECELDSRTGFIVRRTFLK